MKKLLFRSCYADCNVNTSISYSPGANLKINGDITPPTCTVNAGDNDIIIDYV
ncbi:fimbrial subunit [Proteus mirabilis]|uniref:Fimbrial subunit n=1 Tax=Proteus mirabilis TaxID=584 RepID=A0A379GF91_PROMI|nr:fimbrial subunit [Proteus mirabilis]